MRRARADELKLSSPIAIPVFEVLDAMGANVAAALAAAQAAPMISGKLADETMAAAAARLGDHALGITIAKRIPLGGLGLVDHALCTSNTLADGLGRLSRNYGVATERVRMTLDLEGGQAALWLIRNPDSPPDRHWIEFSLAAVVIRLRECVSADVQLAGAAFTHPPPPQRHVQDEFFGVRVDYNARRDEIRFPASYLHVPLRTRMACIAEVLDVRMAAIMGAKAAPDDPYIERVRRHVLEVLDGGKPVRIQAVAKLLGSSPRTLQRELQRHETSLAALTDDVRRELALHALSNGSDTIASVAKRLGFAEPSALFRAVRRWTGETPSAVRAKATPDDPPAKPRKRARAS